MNQFRYIATKSRLFVLIKVFGINTWQNRINRTNSTLLCICLQCGKTVVFCAWKNCCVLCVEQLLFFARGTTVVFCAWKNCCVLRVEKLLCFARGRIVVFCALNNCMNEFYTVMHVPLMWKNYCVLCME